MAKGKHHIGDFIPPHELDKFMKTYSVRQKHRNTNHIFQEIDLIPYFILGSERRENARRF